MIRTPVCDILGIEYPIIQGGMGWISGAELAAAVSNAGGLGIISPTAALEAGTCTPDNLRKQIIFARSLTNRPFGVNIPLEMESARENADVAIEEGVGVLTVGAGSPSVLTRYAKDAGVNVIHVVFSVRHALRAEAEGVDAVVASGVEAGGLLSPDELTTMTLVPQVVDAVKIPVIAAGGIGDGRSMAATFMLGAQGVQIGTLFVATCECAAHSRYKELIVQAKDVDTIVTGRRSGPARVLKNAFAKKLLDMEVSGVSAEEILSFAGVGAFRRGILDGDLEMGSLAAGQVVGMIKDIKNASDVVRSLVTGCEETLSSWT